MSELFQDPPDHERPQRFKSLPAPGACDPFVGRFSFLVPTIGITVVLSACYLMLPGGSWKLLLLSLPLGPCFGYLMMVAFYGENRRSSPLAFKLAQSDTGRALLNEGNDLHERREHLVALSRGLYPITMAFDVLGLGPRTSLNPGAVFFRIWDHHLALERDLLNRQRRHLAGESVPTVRHLSAT